HKKTAPFKVGGVSNFWGAVQKFQTAFNLETFAKSRFSPEFTYVSSYSGLTRVSLFLLKQKDARVKPEHDASVFRYLKEFCKGLSLRKIIFPAA
uniref:hypothetical protein n=1 Tax=Neisseria dentiae TaxID=194197 RepID=UPI0035A1B912